MIVTSTGVYGKSCIIRQRVFRSEIREGTNDQRSGFRRFKELSRIPPYVGVIGKIAHRTMPPFRNKPQIPLMCLLPNLFRNGKAYRTGSCLHGNLTYYALHLHKPQITVCVAYIGKRSNEYPLANSHSMALGSTAFMFRSALSESWNTMIDPFLA